MLAIHTITTKPLPLSAAVEAYAARGVGGISVWADALGDLSPQAAGELIRAAGLEVVSYVRGGFFAHADPAARQQAIRDNLQLMEQAAALGAPLLVLVCGADPRQPLAVSRDQIRAGIEALLPRAEALGLRLGIEPLHPMYADTRSAISTLAQANDLAEALASPWVGVVIDVYHLWWDPDLEAQIRRCGTRGHLFAYHVCDWKVPTRDMLLDRGLIGEGCIPLRQIGQWVAEAGFTGYTEVEIFSQHYWAQDQHQFLDQIVVAMAQLRA
ncbi:MAG: sugar phosphate isomerase/epimerase [Bacteroidetes bacterium]|nr:MAG: sugar phosphate isomerase/epimerase [Bacteroidota bacterium]